MEWIKYIFGIDKKDKTKIELQYIPEYYNSCDFALGYPIMKLLKIIIKKYIEVIPTPEIKTLINYEVFSELYNKRITNIIRDGCYTLQQTVPSLEWQKSMINFLFNLKHRQRAIIFMYIGGYYKKMNNELRINPNSHAHLNPIINDAVPLPNDIIVLRYSTEYNLPETGTEIEYTGYLSTSFAGLYVIPKPCEYNMILFRIHVPKDCKCLYIPSYEYELIFPHKTKLKIISKTTEKIICKIDDTNVSYKEKNIIDVKIINTTIDKDQSFKFQKSIFDDSWNEIIRANNY